MRLCTVLCLAIFPSVALYWTSLSHQPCLEKAQRMRPLQSLTLEAMLDVLSTTCGHIPDPRHADRVDYSLHDTLMSGFAMLFFQHASLLEFQRKMKQHRGRCNLETLFGVHEVPSDPQMREILDGVPPGCCGRCCQHCLKKSAERAGRKNSKVPCPVAPTTATTIPACWMAVTIFTRLLSSVRVFATHRCQWPEAFPAYGGRGHAGQSGIAPGVAARCGRSPQRGGQQTGL